MDALKRLQLSLAEHYDRAFDEAHRSLAVEISTRDTRIHELETLNRLLQDANADEKARVRELERRIDQLEDISAQETVEAGAATTQERQEERLRTLRSTYDAEQIMQDLTESRFDTTSGKFDKALQQMGNCYNALYDEVQTLLSVTESLRTQVKRHKERATQWQRWYHQNNKEAGPSKEAKNKTKPTSDSATDQSEIRGIRRETSGQPPVNSAGRETDDAGVSHGHDGPVRIKPEPDTPSPIADIPSSREVDPLGTQDLDDVGRLVQTPRRPRLHIHQEAEPTRNQLEKDDYDCRENRPHALQPLDVNTTVPSRERSSKRRKIDDRGSAAIWSVSEDGEHVHNKRTTGHDGKSPTKAKHCHPQTHSRLDELLEERPRAQRQQFGQQTNDSRGRSFERRAHKSTLEPYTSKLGKENDLNSIVRSVPYKERPVDLLDLNCFKPNPARNDGLDYAFKEVVRNRDLRKCLPGCMRPDCCGNKFRAMVRAGGIEFTEQDRALLEEHLGEDRKHTIENMSEAERREALVEIKARALANRFGRHRSSHDRPRSPPGFWRADMPSTQELARDREEADRIEREKIIERLQEALRPNGRWKFADEG